MRKAGAVIFALLILLVHSAFAEVIRLGKTDCLLQPAAEEDTGKRYVLFAGSGDYFFAICNQLFSVTTKSLCHCKSLFE